MLNKRFFVPISIGIISASLFAVTSCQDDKKETEGKEEIVDTDTVKTSVLNVGGELFSVPSPIQTALLIQKSGISYDKSILNASNKVNTFTTDYAKSLNLGIYGADLGYVSLYNQTQDALGYLASVKQLADKLGISAAFDASTMERIQKNITIKDSMMVLVGIAYRGSDAYLKNNQRNDLSSLILTGGWIESMHFSISAYKTKPNNDIKFRIAEQKQALTSLIKILGNNKSPEVVGLTAELQDLAKVYEGIQFKYTFVPPTDDTAKKMTYVNSTTEVVVNDEQIAQISEKIKQIRNKIINATQS
ncbi:MAG: hypothetical protein K0S12_565 [Bacteroidetes bacterium]|jgi:hypothetical protein|nr:hypothetical protein [Bacteroidota bacterium]